MAFKITPPKVQRAVQSGFRRLENFRKTRLMLLRNYTGQYYDKSHGRIGTEPLNLTFNAIRVLVPNLVMNFPKHNVTTHFTAYRDYASILAMALDAQAKDINIRDTYRRWIVDALFCMGILKTGLCQSKEVIYFDEDDQVDPGTVYTELVDFDDFVFAPNARDLDEAAFTGHAIAASRSQLLDSGLYKNDLLERVPTVGEMRRRRAADLSMTNINRDDAEDFTDNIELVELWVPRADAIVTVPREDMNLPDYLRVAEYYGPDEGPFTYLKLTPPVPNNPLPVAPVGIWADLHVMANRMVHKIMQQADRQKDIIGYRRSAADDAQEMVDARDGEAVAMEDPEAVRAFSFGGQQKSNEAHIAQLQMWFNLMSGNTEALGGIRSDAATATQAEILQANGSVGMEDMRDIVYTAASEEARRRAWYLHTDPLIEVPLIKRQQVPAVRATDVFGQSQLVEPARIEDQQIILTPEARRGDFLNYQFEIVLRSMSRLDPVLQSRNTLEFLIKAVPAAVQAAQASAMMGVPLSFPRLLARIARDQYQLEWFDEVFYDPEFQQVVAQVMQQTPGMEGSQGMAAGIAQNGQPANLPKVQGPGQQKNSQRQQGAAPAQGTLRTNEVV